MLEIVLLVFLSYKNSVKAKQKGLNPILWAFITVGAYFMALLTGGMIVIFNFCKECLGLAQLSSVDPKSREAASQQLVAALSGNPLHVITIEAFGLGGFLLVYYILSKKPDKKEPEVHWMDRMGQQ
jgi:hypothetical protein